jgi:hypothetical protein
MRKEKSSTKSGLKSYARKAVIAFAAAASVYLVQDRLDDYYESQERQLSEYTESYIDAVNEGDGLTSRFLLFNFESEGLSLTQIQAIKNAALLDVADKGKFDSVDLALENGANIDSQGEYGESFSTLLFDSRDWDAYLYLKKLGQLRDDFDLKFLLEDDFLQWSLLRQSEELDDEDSTLLDFLDRLLRGGVDLTTIGHTLAVDSVSLVDLARNSHSSALMMFLEGEGVYDDKPEALRWNYGLYEDYLQKTNAPLVEIAKDGYSRSDFEGYGGIYNGGGYIADNDLDPTLFVIEKPTAKKDEAEQKFNLHIDNTSYSAYGVSKKLNGLLAGSFSPVIAAKMNLTADPAGINSLLEYAAQDYVVVSQSTRMVPVDEEQSASDFYQSKSNARTNNFASLDVDYSYVYYLPAGNHRSKSCIEVDDKAFCMQDTRYTSHNKDIVRVGAVTQEDEILSDPVYTVASYSEERPTFCAVLPMRNEVALRGTSYSTPAAAAVERKLADIFARSAAFPQGLTHDDIVMALMLTSQSEGLIDEATAETEPVYKNIANIKMTDLCGAGVIQPEKAADLLTEMVGWSIEDDSVGQTQGRLVKSPIQRSTQKAKQGGYSYSVRVSEAGLLINLRAGIFFEKGKKGAAEIQIGNSAPVTLDLSASGLTTDFRFAGHKFAAGDIIKITTTKPLIFPASNSSRPFLDLKLVQTNSPIAKAVKRFSQEPGV